VAAPSVDRVHLLIGFATGLSLIVAIGAQNAFVLRQGIRREHVLAVVLVCVLSDALLITAGIVGLGTALESRPTAITVAKYAGAAFLIAYGIFAIRRSLRPDALTAASTAPGRLRGTLLACLGFTYLNPHVYLDTVVLLGVLANQQGGGGGRWLYGAGAVIASSLWFSGLGFFARRLGPLFARPRSWQFLDGGIALVMFGLGAWMALG
jgi:L-lysine exporter family protein LysE/ArgO